MSLWRCAGPLCRCVDARRPDFKGRRLLCRDLAGMWHDGAHLPSKAEMTYDDDDDDTLFERTRSQLTGDPYKDYVHNEIGLIECVADLIVTP